MTIRREARWTGIAVLAALLGYAGCGDDDEGDQRGGPDGGGGDAGSSIDGGAGDSGSLEGGGDSDTGTDAGDPLAKCDPADVEGRIGSGSWDPRLTIPGLTGFDGYVPAVHGLARDGDGALLVAGYFQWAGRERVGALARLESDGTWKPARTNVLTLLGEIPGVPSGTVHDMVFDPLGRLWIVGGRFGDNLMPAGFVARWTGSEFTTLETDFDNFVSHVAFEPGESGRFVVGGGFTRVGALPAERVAHWDGASWRPLGTGFDTPPGALAYAADAIYASTTPGDSTTGQDVQWVLGRWDGTSWQELGVPERGLPLHIRHARGSKHQIRAIWAQGRKLVVAGAIYPEGTNAANGGRNAFLFDGERFEPIAGGVGAIGVDSMAVTPNALYFGGFVATTGGGDRLAPSIGLARFQLGAPE